MRAIMAICASPAFQSLAAVVEAVAFGAMLHRRGFSVAESFILGVAWLSLRWQVTETLERVRVGKR
jgi:hypothetical protein